MTMDLKCTGAVFASCRVQGLLLSHLLLFYVHFVTAQVRIKENDILLLNQPISVPYGRSIHLDPINHLRIRVRPEDRCQLTIQEKRDLSYSIGKLSHSTFSCNFGPELIKYSHYGGRTLMEDRIHMVLRYDSPQETVIIPFSLIFKIIYKPLDVVLRNEPITVRHHMGISSTIDETNLEFFYDQSTSICKLSVLARSNGLPRYGYLLLNNSRTLTDLDCDRFLTQGLRYKHNAQINAPNKDHIPMNIKILSTNGETLREEFFQVIVNILSGQENTRPEPSRNSLFVMDSVNQYIMTALTPDIISAYDNQTPSDRLMFIVSQPLGPGEGFIINTDNRDIPISSFFQHQVNDLKIAYKPPSSDSNIKRVFQLELIIQDPEGLMSDPIPLMIVVEPMNTLSPIVTKNTGIQLLEGESRHIVSPEVLEISDEDNLEDVKIYHIDGLRHGYLLLTTNRKYFTVHDLYSGNILYRHDDSDTFSDNIVFRMTDGMHDVEFLFPVTIYPKDDHAPTLNVNTGLDIMGNELVEINEFILSATDSDSDAADVRFNLEPPYSKSVFLKRQFQIPEDVENWQFGRGVYERSVNQFTQRDITNGMIFYRHVGERNMDVVFDKVYFKVSDGGTPPNTSPLYEFVVKVKPVDDIPPTVYPNVKLQLDVEEAELVHFRRKNLRYSDDSNEREIMYIITRPPYDTYENGPSDAGYLCRCEVPEVIISEFKQAEVNHHKICYKPPNAELGIAARIIQFDFEVKDIFGNILPDQRYTIVLKPINNQPPVVINAGAQVLENNRVVITPQMLDIQDRDTDIEAIMIIVTRVPQHGTITNRKQFLGVGDKFTRKDISKGHIVYLNSGEAVEVTEDEFTVDVTDGIHYVPIEFKISVTPTDDEPALFKGPIEDGNLMIHADVLEGQSVMIEPKNFHLSDRDSNIMDIVYEIKTLPKFGVLQKNGRRINQFTQRDVTRGKVNYVHVGEEIGKIAIEDNFELRIPDRSRILLEDGSRVRSIQMMVTVKPVDNIPPTVTIGQNIEVTEGEKKKILPINLDITDTDTNAENVLCTITIQPKKGYLENIAPDVGSERSRTGLPISAFSVQDLTLGNILYVQSVHKGIEPRRDDFSFQCTDGLNTSPQSLMNILILPSNDETPEVFVREFIGSEGMEISIDLPILTAVDKDEPADVLEFIITSPPTHGKIIKQSRNGDVFVNKFTLDDIKQFSTIVYEHDDSETITDNFEFLLTDGKHNVTKKVPILIFPVDDETPRLSINNGLEIEELGERKFITNDILKAEDLDSYIGNITYILRTVPKQGYLLKYLRTYETNLTVGSNFTQLDIDNMLVEYVHTGTEAIRDLIKFDVTDGLNPLIDRYFYVTVQGMDTIYPEVINRGVQLPEGGIVTLTTDIISGTDLNSKDEDLLFSITRAPLRGHLEFSHDSGVPVLEFKQMDLAANRVRYVHDADDEIKMDSFEFEVTDGYNPVSRTFRIALTDVDNKKPVLMFSSINMKEGGNKLITPFELRAVDQDTPDEDVIFTITQVPLHGNLLYNFSKIISKFTQYDLSQNMISYQHDGTETLSDSFTFTVTDGTHSQFFIPGSSIPTRRPQEMDIEIIAIDNGIPQLSVNQGCTYLSPTDIGLGFVFTNRILRADDRDSEVDKLRFSLTVPPSNGYLRNTKLGTGRIDTWTQGDIDRTQIQYVLNPGSNATSDSFFFKVTDEGDNVLNNQPFHLTWGWISFKDAAITVQETKELLEVTLLRRGYLGETSFVTIEVTDRTAKLGKDVSRQFAQQVQFNPGQTEKTWRLPLRDDNVYEGEETLILQLKDPVSVVVEYPDVCTVTILDPEDESTVSFPEVNFKISEGVNQLDIPVFRSGDLSEELIVICSTVQILDWSKLKEVADNNEIWMQFERKPSLCVTAKGTPHNRVESNCDYISRAADHNNILRFDKNEDNKYCVVTIIDDTLFEDEESFKVVLSTPMGGKIGSTNETIVIIEPDPKDEPVFYFNYASYHVDESVGTLEVKVWRTGTDMSRPSSITVRSRRTEPASAEAGQDYVAVIRILDFAPGEMTKTLQITILEDLGQPVLEGAEQFELHLRMPVGGSVGEPSVATIIINDSISDLPKMEFASSSCEVLESEEAVVAIVTRSGDLGHESKVRCYTRQSSAQVMDDYVERPDTNASFVFFKPGQREAECRVKIVNDRIHEVEESFRLVLGTPDSSTAGGASIGGQDTARILVFDPEDKPVIKFEHSRYTVNEPIIKGDINVLKVAVIRIGDTSKSSSVRVYTKSGSASAGRDFNAFARLFKFEPGVERLYAEIEINYDEMRENSEIFSIHLTEDRNSIAEVRHNSRATIFIEEKSKLANVIFPELPIVISLRDVDNVDAARNAKPVQGYPLVCVSPCSPKHPEFPNVSKICMESGMNDTLTKYRWRVGPAGDMDGVTGNMRDLEMNTAFTSTRHVTLDSVYFTGGSQVQCFARAVNSNGEPGKEIGSEIVVIDRTGGICPPRLANSIGADPFTARLRYTGPDDPSHPNTIKLTVQIPHTDGMLPLLSTNRLSNFDLALSADGFRLGQHKCSNMLDVTEVPTRYGFITNLTRQSKYQREVEPYQMSSLYRPGSTLRFYKNLDLESCLWTFEGYYGMSELVSQCGGQVTTNGQVMNVKQSYVTLQVPFYVSYLFHSPQPGSMWRHFDMRTKLNMTFVYDTSILWQEGVRSPQNDIGLQGNMYPASMRIREDGKLVVNFNTRPQFRGQFVEMHKGSSYVSSVECVDRPDLNFDLSLVRSDPTLDQPTQLWEAVSSIALKDYSGNYEIQLLPCIASPSQQYSLPLMCTPTDLVTFDLPIRFQQVSDPVPAEFSLNTQFSLVRNKDRWLAESARGVVAEEDAVFAPGDIIYARVDVDPVQSLGNEFLLNIEKVFLCSGKDGYIPKYNPDNEEFGCVGNSKYLDNVLRLVDIDAPHTIDRTYDGLPFNCLLASEDNRAKSLVAQSGADGFSCDSSPLFQEDTGKQWFLHTIYNLQGSSNALNGRRKRETEIYHIIKRAVEDIQGVGRGEKGTNMVPLMLNFEGESYKQSQNTPQDEVSIWPGSMPFVAILVGVVLLLLIIVFVLIIFIRHRRKQTSPPPTPSGTITVMSATPGQTRVISNAHLLKNGDNTEV